MISRDALDSHARVFPNEVKSSSAEEMFFGGGVALIRDAKVIGGAVGGRAEISLGGGTILYQSSHKERTYMARAGGHRRRLFEGEIGVQYCSQGEKQKF